MKNKFIIGAVCAGVLGLVVYVLSSGAKRIHNPKSGGEAMTVVVELPRTNQSAASLPSDVKYQRDRPR